jgi:lactate dehydrogenase-like 2-hydroxyacid dehydrogenase
MIDLPACARRHVLVTNVPAASIESVAEHALALFFALRRNVVRMHELTVGTDEWVKKWSLKDDFGPCPGTCREEVVGVLGGGELGPLFSSRHHFSFYTFDIFSSRYT